jgi:hypothetical protein
MIPVGRCLRRRSAAARLLVFWVRTPRGALIDRLIDLWKLSVLLAKVSAIGRSSVQGIYIVCVCVCVCLSARVTECDQAQKSIYT